MTNIVTHDELANMGVTNCLWLSVIVDNNRIPVAGGKLIDGFNKEPEKIVSVVIDDYDGYHI